ncbi:MAG: NADH-quinone oxidoreductase subunit M [Bacteroidota bacterium]
MLTSSLILIPLIGAALGLLAKGNNSKIVALLVALVNLVLTGILISQFNPAGGVQFEQNCSWIPSLGVNYHVGIDGISILMVLLANIAGPLIILSQFNRDIERAHIYNALILFMQAAMIGVFVSLDGFLYYIFWELALIPIFFLMLGWGGPNRQAVTLKFFLYTLAGSLFMLVGFVLLYVNSGGAGFDHSVLVGLQLDETTQRIIFGLLFIAFAIKMPIFPFHSWQPGAYTEAPTQGTMLLSGVMLKMGIYSVFRWILPIVPDAVSYFSTLIIVLSVIGIIYGSWIAIRQKDLKTLFAFASFAHVGLIAAGLFTNNAQGLQGALIQSLVHGINAIGLFYCADIIQNRLGDRLVDGKGGIRLIAPAFATLFIIVLFGTVALPLTNGFVGEFLLLAGIADYSIVLSGVAGLTVILCAVYMLRSYQYVMLGENSRSVSFTFPDLVLSEKITLIIIAALVIFIGVYPDPILKLTEPAVLQLLEQINA